MLRVLSRWRPIDAAQAGAPILQDLGIPDPAQYTNLEALGREILSVVLSGAPGPASLSIFTEKLVTHIIERSGSLDAEVLAGVACRAACVERLLDRCDVINHL